METFLKAKIDGKVRDLGFSAHNKISGLAWIFHEYSAASPQVVRWPRHAARFNPQRIDNTLKRGWNRYKTKYFRQNP